MCLLPGVRIKPAISSLGFSPALAFSALMAIPVVKLENMRILAWTFSEKTVHFQVHGGVLHPPVAACGWASRPHPLPQPPCLPAPHLTHEVESQVAS